MFKQKIKFLLVVCIFVLVAGCIFHSVPPAGKIEIDSSNQSQSASESAPAPAPTTT